MKNKVKIAVLSGGILAGLASLIPLTSYAASDNGNVTITATVNPSITLTVGNGPSVTGNAGEVMTGQISTTVKSNKQYTIGFKVADTYWANKGTTAMTTADSNDSIPAGTNVATNTSAWGIKAKTGASAGSYVKITQTDQTLYTSTGKSADTGDAVSFDVGISTSPNITAGSYSVDLTVTASAN